MSNYFVQTITLVDAGLHPTLARSLDTAVDSFCSFAGDRTLPEINLGALMYQVRSITAGSAASCLAENDVTAKYLAQLSDSLTICCTYTAGTRTLSLVLDMLPFYVMADPLKLYSAFVFSELRLNTIH